MSQLSALNEILGITEIPYLTKSRALPFLKWAGGKRSIIPQISIYLPKTFNDYYEPFIGGGAVFFALESRIKHHAHLSDVNRELMLTYKVVQTDCENLIEALQAHKEKHCAEYYKKIREQHENKDPIKLAARFIYLNKTCFNGLYRVNSGGRFNVPMGKYTNPGICDEVNLRAASEVLKTAFLSFGAFNRIEPNKGDFIYCDPPYHGTFTDYSAGGFDDEKQKALKDAADSWVRSGALVMLSNSDTPFIRKLYKGYNIVEVSAPRSINCKVEGRENAVELLITSY